MTLKDLRTSIDRIDDQILALLNERAGIVRKVAALKERQDVPFYVPSRERAIVERLQSSHVGPFPADAIKPVFQEIFSACLSLEEVVKVAYLGPEATFTHMAAKYQFGLSARAIAMGTISGVFEQVEQGGADFGVVPVENSSEGMVNHTLDTFVDTELKISAEIVLPIAHCLLARAGTNGLLADRVYSHPQALGQCRAWLTANMSRAALVEAASTADAARMAREDQNGAAIASEFAATLYDLSIQRHNLVGSGHNMTRFLVIGKRQADPTGRDKTSLVFATRDEPGLLYSVLGTFATQGINLSKIESRPSRKRAWDYVFFIDIDGHASTPAVSSALKQAGEHCDFLKILGSYPAASLPATSLPASPT